ncbi:MAG: arylformamidase [Armatimonadetes bacterium]|nr:arylformamidase [Armatimonadota bacterium]
MEFYDITRPIQPSLAVWPGDTPYRLDWTLRRENGHPVNVANCTTTVHLGSHADAPLHFRDAGEPVGELDLAPFLGPVLLLEVTGKWLVGQADLEPRIPAGTERLLLRTGTWPDASRFPERIATLEPEAAAWLGSRGLRLLGVDAPSVDLLESETLPVHHALDRAGVRILEGLALDGVPEGDYELLALPLRLLEADASPVRAVLRPRSA